MTKFVCWIKGIGIAVDGWSWWAVRYNLIHPKGNLGGHKWEYINHRMIDKVPYFDMHCSRCGFTLDNWQGVTPENRHEVIFFPV